MKRHEPGMDRLSRQMLEDVIEALIFLLDAADSDPDLEEADVAEDDGTLEDELGAHESWHGSQEAWSQGCSSGREFDADDEPSLGSVERGADAYQPAWSNSGSDDLEEAYARKRPATRLRRCA